MSDWRQRLLEDDTSIFRLLMRTRRIAVLGIKPESRAHKPAYYVPAYLQRAGYEIVPVPVYYAETREILGKPVYRRLVDVRDPIDLVVVFRKPKDIPAHVPDILAASPRAVWFQLGIRHEDAAETLARAGIEVVQDRCTLVEHRRMTEGSGTPGRDSQAPGR